MGYRLEGSNLPQKKYNKANAIVAAVVTRHYSRLPAMGL
jgi:hypothetical protein